MTSILALALLSLLAAPDDKAKPAADQEFALTQRSIASESAKGASWLKTRVLSKGKRQVYLLDVRLPKSGRRAALVIAIKAPSKTISSDGSCKDDGKAMVWVERFERPDGSKVELRYEVTKETGAEVLKLDGKTLDLKAGRSFIIDRTQNAAAVEQVAGALPELTGDDTARMVKGALKAFAKTRAELAEFLS